MANQEVCTICKNKVEHKKFDGIKYEVMCELCGDYSIERSLDVTLFRRDNVSFTLSSWITEQNKLDIYPKLLMSDIDRLTSIPDKPILEKYHLVLEYISQDRNRPLEASNSRQQVLFWCSDNFEYEELILKAIDEEYIKVYQSFMPGYSYLLTFKGREYLETFDFKTNSNKIFMAFQFNNEMKELFEPVIRKAVADASENRLEAVRVSSSSTDHDTKIDDELIAMLKSSKAVIVDFTGQRNAVYYEAGYAMGLGLPVIWTCRESDADSLSFDTRQYPHIIWKDEDDLYKQVVNRLKAKIL